MASRLTSTELPLSRYNDVDRRPTNEPLDESFLKEDLYSLEDTLKNLVSKVPQLDLYTKYSKKNCNKTGEYKVSNEESAAIYLYTIEFPDGVKSFYLYLNEAARNESDIIFRLYFQYMCLLISGLKKFPSIPVVVWRGFKHDATNEYKGNETFIWRGVSSCSRDPQTVIDKGFFGPPGSRTMFRINAKNGKHIAAFSMFEKEHEIVLLPGTRFRVTREAKNETVGTLKDVPVIDLEEL
jgi:hypothetical protein